LQDFFTVQDSNSLFTASSFFIYYRNCCRIDDGVSWRKIDLFFQRIIEIWNNIPFLYAIIIIASIVIPSFFSLLGIMIFFGWIGITWYVRTATYREREREYVLAARALGASTARIIIRHILPNIVSVIITFIPFSIAGGITALTALDYLGSDWHLQLQAGASCLRRHQSIISGAMDRASVISALIFILTMVTFIGEAIRESFDPKKYTTYDSGGLMRRRYYTFLNIIAILFLINFLSCSKEKDEVILAETTRTLFSITPSILFRRLLNGLPMKTNL
jgi:microcin C transport system permease protein